MLRFTFFRSQIRGDLAELFERRLEVFHNFGGDDVGSRKISGVFEGFVFEPEDVEVDFVAFDEVVIGEAFETLRFVTLVAIQSGSGVPPLIPGKKARRLFHTESKPAGNEVVEIGAFQLVLFQREVLVGPEIVDPEIFRPGLFLCGLAVEEKQVGLHTLRLENARRQTQQCVHVGLLEQFTPHRLPRSAFEKHVVRHDDRGSPMLLEDREYVLQKVELFVARRSPKIITVNRQTFLLRLPSSLTIVTLLFFPNGGLVITMS